jgi:hypothetical protein
MTNLATDCSDDLADDLSLAKIIGIGNLSATNYFTTAGGGGTPGDASGFYVAYFCRPILPANADFWGAAVQAAAGWSLRQLASTTLQFRCANGAGTFVNSPALTLTSLVNKACCVMGVHDGSHVRLYANLAEVSSGTAITGYTAPSGATGHAIGSQNPSGNEFYGMVSGLGVPSLANFQAWCLATKRERAVQDMPGVPAQHMWRASALANISDLIGSSTMLKRGTGHTLVENIDLTWAF